MIPRPLAAAALLAAAFVCPTVPMHAENVLFNFNTGEQGWQSLSGWEWSADQSNQKSWKLIADRATDVNILLSPCFIVVGKWAQVEFVMNEGHRFNFGNPKAGIDPPPGAGQLQFSTSPEDPGSWRGIGLSGGGWSDANNDVPPTLDPAGLADPGPLLDSGLAFVGVSPGYLKPNNDGVSSLAILPPLDPGTPLQFRFVAAVRDPRRCPDPSAPGPIWDVNKVLVKGVELHPCPESVGWTSTATGLALASAAVRWRRRWRRPPHGGRAPAGWAPARA